MEICPEKVKINQININEISQKKRYNNFNYFKHQKISPKKYSNSTKQFINKKKNLANKYNLTDKYVYSVINKSFKRYKTSLLESEKNFSKNYILESLVNKNYLNMKTIKKSITFEDESNIKITNNINKINIDDNLYKRQKCKSMTENLLPIPLKSRQEFKKEDFDVIALCGKGAYGTVLQVKLKTEQENKNPKKSQQENYYAIKVIDIQSMKKVNKIYQIYMETEILHELNSPFIVKIFGAFPTKKKVYMVLEYLSNGNFAKFLKYNYPLKEDTIKFYSAEIVLFLEYLQSQKIVHRDLKPENIMLNEKYHLQMIDFATVRKIGLYYDKLEMKFKKDDYDFDNDNDDIKGTKLVVNPDNDEEDEEENEDSDDMNNDNDINFNKNIIYSNSDKKIKKMKKPQRNKTFVGTAEYVSPEVISNIPAGYGADLWAFGVILYQMYCGQTPFKSATNYLTFKNIEKTQIVYPDNINVPKIAKDLIDRILVKEPEKRLGAGEPNTDLDIAHLKKHPFFKGIKWKNITSQNVPNSKNFKFRANKKIIKTLKNSKNKKEIKEEKKEKNVEIIKQGILLKKSFWFIYTEYFLTLDNTPKIEYKKVDKDEIEGIILLNGKCKVYATSSDVFNLDTPNGNYKFKNKQNDLIIWINAIKDCIKKYGKEQ